MQLWQDPDDVAAPPADAPRPDVAGAATSAEPDPGQAKTARPAGIEGSDLAGPYPVGEYAEGLRRQLRDFARVQVFGEVSGLGVRRNAVYFDLRDDRGALPCSMWRHDYDRAGVKLEDGLQVVLAGGCDYYTGSATSSPAFSFRATELELAGEGQLLAQIERLRRRLHGEGLFELQKALPLPAIPQAIGVVTGETGKARDDIAAALARRGWHGRIVWGFAPVQDRRAAPAITRALQDLVAIGEVDVIVVARGGGSVMDLMAFSDETLCRTVALLSVPVIASVGHHTDRTLIDDVAAVSCSTPTHAAEAAVPIDCGKARLEVIATAQRIRRAGRRAVVHEARRLIGLSRAPGEHVARHRTSLEQTARELRAASRRRTAREREETVREAQTLRRRLEAAGRDHARGGERLAGSTRELDRSALASLPRRRRELDQLLATLAAHDPDRTLERGYALVEDGDGGLIASATEARSAGHVSIRFSKDRVKARIEDQ